MSTPIAPDDGRTAPAEPSSSVARAPEVVPPGRSWSVPGGVTKSLLAATLVVAILVSGAVWLENRRTQQALRVDVARRLTQIENAAQASAKSQAQLAADVRDTQAKIALLEARLAESQEQQASLEALYRDLAPSRDELALIEIEQLLMLGDQQLELAGNVSGALAALQMADAKLQRLERPQFLPLRRALSRDIDRLKGVPFVDVAGMTLRLDQALAAVDALPFAMEERLPPPAPATAAATPLPAWRQFLHQVWEEIRQLVRIEVSDRPAAPLLPPAQQYFLRENVKLRLLSARLALLNRDDVTFKADLAATDTWLGQYFDTRAKPVQTVQSTLHQLAATPMPSEVPDIARTLDAVRVLRLSLDRAPTPSSAPAARSAR